MALRPDLNRRPTALSDVPLVRALLVQRFRRPGIVILVLDDLADPRKWEMLGIQPLSGRRRLRHERSAARCTGFLVSIERDFPRWLKNRDYVAMHRITEDQQGVGIRADAIRRMPRCMSLDFDCLEDARQEVRPRLERHNFRANRCDEHRHL